jgi:hypothetical protein
MSGKFRAAILFPPCTHCSSPKVLKDWLDLYDAFCVSFAQRHVGFPRGVPIVRTVSYMTSRPVVLAVDIKLLY